MTMINSTNITSLCDLDDRLCVVKVYQPEIIVIPVLLLGAFLITLITVCILRVCSNKNVPEFSTLKDQQTFNQTNQRYHHHKAPKQHHSNRQHLQGIDAPPEFNVLENETIPMAEQTLSHKPFSQHAQRQMTNEKQYDCFQQITPLDMSFTVQPANNVTLYKATMDQKPIVLRVLKESANDSEKQDFLDFLRFISELGPQPFLPSLLGVVTTTSPLIMAFEELENQDLLGFLWKCRQDQSGSAAQCKMTEKRIFKMGCQIASALAYLHSKNIIHGNIGARSVLVGQDLSVKLWGFGPAFCRKTRAESAGQVEPVQMRKWHAPEVLVHRPVSQYSDIWSFGILLYEMVILGEPPFPGVIESELVQYLQRGGVIKRPASCSSSIYALIKACCQWRPQDRASVNELISKLQFGERNASDVILHPVPGPLNYEKYMKETGYGDVYNFAVL